MSKRISGKIKTWQHGKGFGFIAVEGQEDVFLHITDVPERKKPKLKEPVTFEIGEGRNGKSKAINVQFSDTMSQQNSPSAWQQYIAKHTWVPLAAFLVVMVVVLIFLLSQ